MKVVTTSRCFVVVGDLERGAPSLVLNACFFLVFCGDLVGLSLHSCNAGNTATAGVLITLGAKIDARDRNEALPLHHAIMSGSYDIAEQLLAAGSPAASLSKGGRPALLSGIESAQTEIVKLLLAHGASPDTYDPNTG